MTIEAILNDVSERLARRIDIEMTRNRWTNRDFAKLAGLTEQALSNLRNGWNGKRPEYRTVYRIARALGTTTEELLGLPPLKKKG